MHGGLQPWELQGGSRKWIPLRQIQGFGFGVSGLRGEGSQKSIHRGIGYHAYSKLFSLDLPRGFWACLGLRAQDFRSSPLECLVP